MTSRWFLSFRRAVAESHEETMVDDSDYTRTSPHLDREFWRSRSTDTGPVITFYGSHGAYGTRASALDPRPVSGVSGVNGISGVSETDDTIFASNSDKHVDGGASTTTACGFRVSFDQSGPGRPRRPSVAGFSPNSFNLFPVAEERPPGFNDNQQGREYVELRNLRPQSLQASPNTMRPTISHPHNTSSVA